jgi:hypothetical protein
VLFISHMSDTFCFSFSTVVNKTVEKAQDDVWHLFDISYDLFLCLKFKVQKVWSSYLISVWAFTKTPILSYFQHKIQVSTTIVSIFLFVQKLWKNLGSALVCHNKRKGVNSVIDIPHNEKLVWLVVKILSDLQCALIYLPPLYQEEISSFMAYSMQ